MNAQQRHQFGGEPVGFAFVVGSAANQVALQLLQTTENLSGVFAGLALILRHGRGRAWNSSHSPQPFRCFSKVIRHISTKNRLECRLNFSFLHFIKVFQFQQNQIYQIIPAMTRWVFSTAPKLKIAGPIVVPLAVFMVNMLTGQELSTQQSFHDKNVLQHPPVLVRTWMAITAL